MNTRDADGGDKAAAFERGMTDEQAHLFFETSGVMSVVIDETWLVAYKDGWMVIEVGRFRLYNNGGAVSSIEKFLSSQALA